MFPQQVFNSYNSVFLCKEALMEKDKMLPGRIPCQLYQFWLYLHFSSSRTGMRMTNKSIWWTLDLSEKEAKRLWIKWAYEAGLILLKIFEIVSQKSSWDVNFWHDCVHTACLPHSDNVSVLVSLAWFILASGTVRDYGVVSMPKFTLIREWPGHSTP